MTKLDHFTKLSNFLMITGQKTFNMRAWLVASHAVRIHLHDDILFTWIQSIFSCNNAYVSQTTAPFWWWGFYINFSFFLSFDHHLKSSEHLYATLQCKIYDRKGLKLQQKTESNHSGVIFRLCLLMDLDSVLDTDFKPCHFSTISKTVGTW